jgi:Ca-activated chloride channel family protein
MQMPKALLETARRSQFPVYFLYLTDKLPEAVLTETGNTVVGYTLQQMADASGGQVIVGQMENTLQSNAEKLRDALKTQYILGFTSTNTAKDGKWRKLAVKVNPPAELTKLKVTARQRYYVPKSDEKD